MSWEAIGAGILLFVLLLTAFFVYLTWRLFSEVAALKETRMGKKTYETEFNTPLGSVAGSASGSLTDGLETDLNVDLTPTGAATATGVGGALAYGWLAGLAGVWTVPLIAGMAGAIWLYRKQAAAKQAKEFPPGPGTL